LLFAKYTKVADSLFTVYKTAKHDTLKLNILFALANEFYLSNPDTSEIICTRALQISQKINSKKDIAEAYNWLAFFIQQKGYIDKAIDFNNKSLKLKIELNNQEGMADSYNNLGIIFYNQGNVDVAISHFKKSLKIYETLNLKKELASSLNNMAYIYKYQGEIETALKYYKRSLNVRIAINDKKGIADSYNNLGGVYETLQIYGRSIEHYEKSIELKQQLNDISGLATTYNNLGSTYQKQNKFDLSIEFFNKSLKLSEQIGKKSAMSNTLNNIGNILFVTNKFKDAINYYEKSLYLAQEIGNLEHIKNASKGLGEAYSKNGDFKNAWLNYNLFVRTKDSIYDEKNQKAVINQKFQYEYEKKQATDSIAQVKENEIKNLELKRQKQINYAFIIGFLIVLVFSIFLLRLFIQKKRANVLLAFKNEEISQQKEEIEAQRDTVVKQKDEIEIIHSELSQSIDYATRLQTSILPSSAILDEYLAENFILLKPKDKVSGDFYWWTNIENLTIMAVADCTGHGVPGAFMSMLGISFLNDIVSKQMITNPAEILNKLRQEIIKSLQQKGLSGEQKDGMDMAIICINHSENKMLFAGANNPIYIVKSEKLKVKSEEKLDKLSTFNFQLNEVKPDKMPIAIYERMDTFTVKELTIEKGDCVYLFSDGFADQFGEKTGKKFKYQPFKNLLLENSSKPMFEQKIILNSEFKNWKGNTEQVDDVLVVGIRI
jgi:serine phosphatase RsbU (regulator of sigma subunit)/Tfp pilus assembly protein PilF